MKYIQLLCTALLLQLSFAKAQVHPQFAAHLKNSTASLPTTINLLVKGDVEQTKAVVLQLGGLFKYASGDICSVVIPANQYEQFLKSKSFQSVERPYHQGHTMSDQALINNNVTPVHTGTTPLPQGYDGTGVVVGVLDSGLDFNHTDFKLANGHTRVKYLWDQTMTTGGAVPSPYGYGINWDSTAINNHTCTHVPNTGYFGHGTLTTGVAVGNSQGRSAYRAIAPNADIIFVAVDLNGSTGIPFETCITDGAAYCFAKAAAMGKPCVINASLGSYGGSHDGTDLATQLIENMVMAQNGRMFVSAAGNAGGAKFHLGYTIPSDSAYTYFNEVSNFGYMYFELYSDYANFNNAYFAIGADKVAPTYNHRNRTKLLNVLTDYQMSTQSSFLRYDTIKNNNGQQLGILESYCEKQNGHYFMYFGVYIDSSTNYTWRFLTKGSGKFDVWSHPNLTGTSLMRTTGLPSVSQLPDIAKYAMPDTEQTIVSGWNCSPKLISVANYLNRSSYTTWHNTTFNCDPRPAGQRYPSSSKGPTRTGLQKPDIAASGEWTMAANDLYWLNWAKTGNPNSLYVDTMHGPHKGTSAAAPTVSGIIALYLQKYPNASWSDIKAALTTCVKRDAFTGNNLPNANWGYGKVDAFAMLNCKGCTVSTSPNFNPYAQLNDGSCLPPVVASNDFACFAKNASANSGSLSGSSQLSSYDHGATAFNGVSNLPSANPPSGPNLIYYTGNTAAATSSGSSEPVPACGTAGSTPHSVWFKFMAPTVANVDVTIRTQFSATNFNTILAAYTVSQDPCNAGLTTYNAIGCSTSGTLQLNASALQSYAGQLIYVQLMGNGTNSPFGNYLLSIQATTPTPVVTTTTTSSIALNIPIISGATAKLYWALQSSTGNTSVTLNSSQSTYTITNLLSGQNYKIWLRYNSSQQTFFSNTVAASTQIGCSGVPNAPSATAITGHCSRATVNWPTHPSATSYRLYWRVQGSSGYSVVAVNGTTYSLSNLQLNTTYDIWYKVICTGNLAVSSTIATYQTCSGPAREAATTPTFTVNDRTFTNADPREVAAYTDPVINDFNVHEITFENEENQAQAIDATWNTYGENHFELIPNPATDQTQLVYHLEGTGTVFIHVSDVTGNVIEALSQQVITAEGAVKIATETLPAGIYLVTIQNENFKQTQRLVVIH